MNQIKVRKINVLNLLQVLSEVYNNGVPYIDILVELKEDQDVLNIIMRDSSIDMPIKLDDDIINKLL